MVFKGLSIAHLHSTKSEARYDISDGDQHKDKNLSGERKKCQDADWYFHDRLRRLMSFIVEPERSVLEVGCQTGDLLVSLRPNRGVGLGMTDESVEKARRKDPRIQFLRSESENFELGEQFDYVIYNQLYKTSNILKSLSCARDHCSGSSRIVVINYNRIWKPFMRAISISNWNDDSVQPKLLSELDVSGFLYLAGFQVIQTYHSLLLPKSIPLLSGFLNKFVAKLPVFRQLCLLQVTVARRSPVQIIDSSPDTKVSVIVPCRNERGNVEPAVNRIPEMGSHTEILFCDDQSTDGTVDEVRRMQRLHPNKDIRLVSGPGVCKADNVWTGFRAARGDVLIILDADLTVIPEELPMFFHALTSGLGEFISGSRMVYSFPRTAMRSANLFANRFFGRVFSFLLDRRIKDSLCGTKALWRKDWIRIERGLGRLGVQDLWGDYELLLGASKLGLEIVEVPVHYQNRIFGVTKMRNRLSNGLRMMRISFHAWYRCGE